MEDIWVPICQAQCNHLHPHHNATLITQWSFTVHAIGCLWIPLILPWFCLPRMLPSLQSKISCQQSAQCSCLLGCAPNVFHGDETGGLEELEKIAKVGPEHQKILGQMQSTGTNGNFSKFGKLNSLTDALALTGRRKTDFERNIAECKQHLDSHIAHLQAEIEHLT